MTKIKATNGMRTRMMGIGELKQNPDWRAVTPADEVKPPAGAKAVRTPGQPKAVTTPVPAEVTPKEVKAPDVPAATSTEEIATAAAGVNGQQEQTRTVAPSPMGELITKIKAAKTADQVNALIQGEDRKTVLDVAAKHINKLATKA